MGGGLRKRGGSGSNRLFVFVGHCLSALDQRLRRAGKYANGLPPKNLLLYVFVFLFCFPTGGESKAEDHHNSTYFRTWCMPINTCRVRNAELAGVSFSSRGNDSARCPYRRSPLLLQQRKLPLYTDA